MSTEREFPIDLGSGCSAVFMSWDPDLELNPQFQQWANQFPIEKVGLILRHPKPDGSGICESGLTFDLPEMSGMDVFGNRPRWQVENWEPLTLSPSILCRECGAHGFIRDGRWVSA